jgi:hypothetical protein
VYVNRIICLVSALALSALLSPAATLESFPLRENNTIAVWTVGGPLPSDPGRSGFGQDFLQATGGENQVVPSQGDFIVWPGFKPVQWQTAITEDNGTLNLVDTFQVIQETTGVAYAFCQLESPQPQEVLLTIRHNDGGRAWLNHKLVYDQPEPGSLEVQRKPIRVALKAGRNPLLCKVDQLGGGWGLMVMVTDLNNKAIKDVTAAVAVQESVKGKFQSVTFAATPLVRKTAAGDRCVFVATVSSGGVQGAKLRFSSPAWPDQPPVDLGNLPLGKKQIELDVPAFAQATVVKVHLDSATDQTLLENVQLRPPKKWTVYLTQHTHTDIGYTRPQTEILPEHLRYIDYALDYCDLTDSYPDDAKFRWTCETSWAVREYLKRRPTQQIERLKKRVQEGRIEITGMLLNMSEIATESSLAASLQPVRTFKADWGVPVRTAMQNDVNGAAWCLVDYFNDIGLKYLTMGINKTRSLLPFDKPTAFWWESPSGKRTLAYRSDHYMTANFWQINQGKLEPFKPGVMSYLRSLEVRNYPFDRVGVQFSGYYTDNSPPSTVGSQVVKAWNEAFSWPRLRISTAHEFLDYVEKEHGNQLPVHRQAWPDWWTDGFGSAARETAASREIHAALQVDANLLAIATMLGASPDSQVLKRIADIQDDLLFYDEHTYGAAESISDPLAENSQVQWGEKAAYIWSAVKNSNLLREEAWGQLQEFLPRAEVPMIAVVNTLNWERSGLLRVFIDHQILHPEQAFRIVDGKTGENVPAQSMNRRAEGTYWALWVRQVPPLGFKMLRIETSTGPRAPDPALGSVSNVLENAFYRLTLDSTKGAVTNLLDKETGHQLVDQDSPWALGQCIYETLPSGREFVRDAFKRASLRQVKVQTGSTGPIWKSLLLEASLDGCAETNGVKVEIRLYETEKRVELHFALRKLPVTSAEAVYVAFPFHCPNAKVFYEAQGGLVVPGKDQIPGSSSDWQTIQNFIALRHQEGQITWGSDQVPLVQLGDLNLGKWQPITQVDKSHVYSWVMNNYWFTNFRASQEGEFKWSYYLTSTKVLDNAWATRFGWGSRIPMVCRVLPAGKSSKPNLPISLSALDVRVPNIVLVEARPTAIGGQIILHLREVEGKPATISQEQVSTWTELGRADEVNVLEETLRDEIESLSFNPFEVKFVRLHFNIN